MPIEIKELHIKAIIGGKDKEPSAGLRQEDIIRLKKEITREVTEKILKTLRHKNER